MKYETIHGVTFTGHALARMRSRGIPPEVAILALRSGRFRWENRTRWLCRITGEHASNPALRDWVGVGVVWDAAEAVVITVYWDKPELRKPRTSKRKVFVRRGARRVWVYSSDQRRGA